MSEENIKKGIDTYKFIFNPYLVGVTEREIYDIVAPHLKELE